MPRKLARNFTMTLASDCYGVRKYWIVGAGEIVGVLKGEKRDAPILDSSWSGPKSLASPSKYAHTPFLRPE